MEHCNKTRISGHIVDIPGKRIFDGTVTVSNGKIFKIEEESVDSDAPYLLPGFIDSHIHIESTLLTPEKYAALAVTKGVVAVVSDPHEIANVLGVEGIDYMVENGRRVHFHFNFEASSCVPCTPFETAGGVIGPDEIAALLERDEICAEGEFMNAFGVITGDKGCLAKIEAAKKAGKVIDGHAPGLDKESLAKYAAAGIATDHECVTLEEAQERLSLGMTIQIREGSAASDFKALSPILADHPDHVCMCSDDKYPNELQEGYIDAMVRDAVAAGYPLWNVLGAACVEPVKLYGLRHGLLREGDGADFIAVDNLKDFNVLQTYIDGVKVFGQGCASIEKAGAPARDTYPNKFAAKEISAEDIAVKVKDTDAMLKVITAADLSLRTGVESVRPKIEGGLAVADPSRDILKIIVYNRYENAAPSVAFIKGFTLRKGAMASTIAHDSHNIVATGTSDEEIVKVVNRLVALKGGIVASDGEKIAELPLPIAGLMSGEDGKEVARKYAALKQMACEMGCTFNAPFMTMAFMALPVIPDLKITDKGLFDVTKFEFTSLTQ